jgi:hypothetical protein
MNKSARLNLTVIVVLVLAAAAILVFTASSTSNLKTVSIKTSHFIYSFDFFKDGQQGHIASDSNNISYTSVSTGAVIYADLFKVMPATGCKQAGSGFKELFQVKHSGVNMPVCAKSNQFFNVTITQYGYNHAIFLNYKTSQPPSSYPTIKRIFSSAKISLITTTN